MQQEVGGIIEWHKRSGEVALLIPTLGFINPKILCRDGSSFSNQFIDFCCNFISFTWSMFSHLVNFHVCSKNKSKHYPIFPTLEE